MLNFSFKNFPNSWRWCRR